MTTLQIRIDDNLRNEASFVASELGIDLPTAVRMFLKQFVRERGLPFSARLDSFYSPANQAALQTSIQQLESGKFQTKTLSELESM